MAYSVTTGGAQPTTSSTFKSAREALRAGTALEAIGQAGIRVTDLSTGVGYPLADFQRLLTTTHTFEGDPT